MTYSSVVCLALLCGAEAFTLPSRTTARPGVAARPVRTRLASYLDNLKDGPSLDVAEPEAEVAAHAPAYKAPRRMAPAAHILPIGMLTAVPPAPRARPGPRSQL